MIDVWSKVKNKVKKGESVKSADSDATVDYHISNNSKRNIEKIASKVEEFYGGNP